MLRDAPIRRGRANPLRVATGGHASRNSELVAAARPPPANRTARLGFGVSLGGVALWANGGLQPCGGSLRLENKS